MISELMIKSKQMD